MIQKMMSRNAPLGQNALVTLLLSNLCLLFR